MIFSKKVIVSCLLLACSPAAFGMSVSWNGPNQPSTSGARKTPATSSEKYHRACWYYTVNPNEELNELVQEFAGNEKLQFNIHGKFHMRLNLLGVQVAKNDKDAMKAIERAHAPEAVRAHLATKTPAEVESKLRRLGGISNVILESFILDGDKIWLRPCYGAAQMAASDNTESPTVNLPLALYEPNVPESGDILYARFQNVPQSQKETLINALNTQLAGYLEHNDSDYEYKLTLEDGIQFDVEDGELLPTITCCPATPLSPTLQNPPGMTTRRRSAALSDPASPVMPILSPSQFFSSRPGVKDVLLSHGAGDDLSGEEDVKPPKKRKKIELKP